MSLYEIAKQYRAQGLSVIPCFRKGKDKRPMISPRVHPKCEWKQFQTQYMTDDEIRFCYEDGANALGVICGQISGGLGLLDFDLRNDPENTVWGPLFSDLVEYFGSTQFPLPLIQTPSGGYHIYFRTDDPGRNQPLVKLTKKGGAVVETRAEGGLFLIPPSDGYVHKAGPTIEHTPHISQDQCDDIYALCRKYHMVFEETRKKPSSVKTSSYAKTPWDHYNNDTDEPWEKVLLEYGWEFSNDSGDRIHYKRIGSDNRYGANWHKDKRLFYVFTSSTVFENSHAYTPTAIYAHLKCDGDFKLAVKELRAAGYGMPFTEKDEKFIARAAGLLEKIPDIDAIIRMLAADWEAETPELLELSRDDRNDRVANDLQVIVEAAESRKAASQGLFWTVNKKGRVSISDDGLKHFLRNNGFKLFSQENDSALYRIVRIDEDTRIVEEMPIDCMMKWVEGWIDENWEDYEVSKTDLDSAVTRFRGWGHIALFIKRVAVADMHFLRDTRTDTYLPFQNTIIHITKDEIRPIHYHELPKGMLLWKNQIKPVDINLPDFPAGTNESVLNNCPVYRFYKRISGITPDLENLPMGTLKSQRPDLFQNLMSFITTTGYLLNNFKDPGRPYMVMLGENTSSDKEGGGAGKDLYIKTLKWIRGVTLLPGKQWKPSASFAFQTYRLGDDILYIADADQHMDFKAMYNVITEGLPIEKKNKDALLIPYELSPKVCVSTNYYIDKSSNHAKRRIRELLFAKYYSDDGIRVEDELGGLFWGDHWTDQDWTMFYLLMFTCIQAFLDKGIVKFNETENMKSKTIKLRFGNEFKEFMDDLVKDDTGKWLPKADLYESFITDAGVERKFFSGRRFTSAMQMYCESFDIVLAEKRSKSRNSGERDKKYVIFTKPGDVVPDLAESIGALAPF